MRRPDVAGDAIDVYVTALHSATRHRVGGTRIVRDAEEHLRDAQADLVAGGSNPAAAAAAAIEAFGSPHEVSTAMPRNGGSLGRQVVRAGIPTLARTMIAIGIVGLASTLIATIAGADDAASNSALLVCVGFVGVSILEARRRNSACGADRATPGLSLITLSKALAAASLLLAATAFTSALYFAATERRDLATVSALVALALAATPMWPLAVRVASGRRSRVVVG